MKVNVYYSNLLVGALQDSNKTRQIYFEYSDEFLNSIYELSPEHLPRSKGVFHNDNESFEYLHGLFYDALPDSWGNRLMEKAFQEKGIPADSIKPLDKLCYLGNRSIGALSFEPDTGKNEDIPRIKAIDFAKETRSARKILKGNVSDIGKELIEAGGSPGGARAKVLAGLSEDGKYYYSPSDLPAGYEYWLIKLDEKPDRCYGILEYAYSRCARMCKIDIPETRIIKTKDSAGKVLSLFAIKRFDRTKEGKRVHVHTLAAMTHFNFNALQQPYEELLKRAEMLVKDKTTVEQVFKRIIFNIAFNNCDDHSKNHSFLMQDNGIWELAPAYDLTFSTGKGKTNTHSMTLSGKYNNFTASDLYAVGKKFGVSTENIDSILNDTLKARKKLPDMLESYHIPSKRIEEIVLSLNAISLLPERKKAQRHQF